MKNICIITARKGSKRIKNKNIKLFNGKPIIYWSIKAALKSKCFYKIIVSTDSVRISNIVKKFGATCDSLRPKKLSGDLIGMDEAIKYEIAKEQKINRIDNVCCILATAPTINPEDIKRSLKILEKNKETIKYVFSATNYDFPIQKYFTIDKKGFLQKRKSIFYQKRTQDIRETFHDAAQFYWAHSETFSSTKNIYNSKSLPYFIPNYKTFDIDEINDWKRSEITFKTMKKMKII